MTFVTDLVRSLYDFAGIGRELSRRRPGQVALVLVLAGGLYGGVSGNWYASGIGDLGGIVAEEVRAHMPEFAITGGVLSSPVEQPYIVTEADLTPAFYQALEDWMRRWFHADIGRQLREAIAVETGRVFCVVLDTTGTYRQRIDPDEYAIAMIVEQDRAVWVGERQTGVREERVVKFDELEQPVRMTPERVQPETVQRAVYGALAPWLIGLGALAHLLRYAAKALLVGALGLALGAVLGRGLTFGRTFAMAVYALVPATVLALVSLTVSPMPGPVLLLVHVLYGVVPVILCPKAPAPAVR